MRNPFKRKRAPQYVMPHNFTGNCMVREYTADGHSVGPCWFSTYDNECPRHGDVGPYLRSGIWTADYQLPKYDGQQWAERLRARQDNHKRGNGS